MRSWVSSEFGLNLHVVNNLEETTGWVKITHGRELLRFVIQDPDGKAFLTGK